ncbi:MAG: glycosyltransferase [Chloroflexi bacterium]|nr:glycosyltransferase [Chloroflexota bacterium]
MPDLSIVILNWNVPGLLVECLRSLPNALGAWQGRSETLVVDNASTDDSVGRVRAGFPGVRLIPLPANRGFAGGNNVGILASQGKYILLLNPDTVARPGSVAALADYMEAHAEVGIAGPRLLNSDGTLQSSRRRFPTLATALVESTPLQRWFSHSNVLRSFYMQEMSDEQTQSVDWLSGAALLCRREALYQAGLLDPGYFIFSEEVDLCRRVRNAGWAISYVPQAEISHYGGQSTTQAVSRRHINFNTSKVRYFRLHEGRVAGKVVRSYLLGIYAAQMVSEAAKWLMGHKRPLRATRLKMYREVLRSGLRERKRQAPGVRTLLITGEYPPARGGVGDYTCQLGRALQQEGAHVKVLTRGQLRQHSANHQHQAQARVEEQIITHDALLHTTPLTRGNIPLITTRITLAATLNALRGTRSKIAHIQYQTAAYDMRPTINLLPLLLSMRWRGTTIATFHDLRTPYLFPKAGVIRQWANRLLARSATAVIATNPDDAAELRAWGAQRISLIPIGSNVPNNPPADFSRERWRQEHGLAPNTILLAYFGFLSNTKGLDDLLSALALLNGQGEYRLVMVGGGLSASDPTNRPVAASINKLAAELQIEDSLIWTGYLAPQEVSAALLSADMAVLPYSDGATFRRGSLLAAVEHSLPLVTTSSPPAACTPRSTKQWPQLQDGTNALLVPPGDSPALADAIQMLAADPALRAALSNASSTLSHFFNWQRIAVLHMELYTRLSSRQGER